MKSFKLHSSQSHCRTDYLELTTYTDYPKLTIVVNQDISQGREESEIELTKEESFKLALKLLEYFYTEDIKEG